MTEGNNTDGKIVVDEILDAPGDFFYPFSNVRLWRTPADLRVTRAFCDSIATTSEDPTLGPNVKAAGWIGACAWAIQELEAELLALRRELSNGQEDRPVRESRPRPLRRRRRLLRMFGTQGR